MGQCQGLRREQVVVPGPTELLLKAPNRHSRDRTRDRHPQLPCAIRDERFSCWEVTQPAKAQESPDVGGRLAGQEEAQSLAFKWD